MAAICCAVWSRALSSVLCLIASLCCVQAALAQVELPVGMADTQATLPPKADGYYNLDSHITVFTHEGAATAGYFWSQQFAFTNGDGGYMGLQTNGRNNNNDRLPRSAVFSMFDNQASVARGVVSADDTRCKNFVTSGGDGTFVSCIVPFDWSEGKEYRLRIWMHGDPTASTRRWSAWVQDTATGAETLIGSIDVPKDWGWLNTFASSFVEYFGPAIARCADIPYTFARWRNITANNGDPIKARARPGEYPGYPSGYERCVDFARASTIDGSMFLETGFGNTRRDGVDLTIGHFYRSGLARNADGPGFAYWRSITRGTGRGEQCAAALKYVAQGFMTSSEFLMHWPDTAQRVDRLYLTLLHRDPDDSGRNYWINRVNTLGNWAMRVVEFLAAEETQARQAAICRYR